MLIWPLILLVGCAGAFALWRRLNPNGRAIPAILWWQGCVLVMAAFLILPWARPGPAGVFDAHLAWLSQQTDYLDLLERIPVESIQNSPLLSQIDDLAGLRQAMAGAELRSYTEHIAQGKTLNGWNILTMSWTTSKPLAVGLAFGLMAVLLAAGSILIVLVMETSGRLWLGLAAGALAALSLLIWVVRIPAIDTLGRNDYLALRLFAALGEVRVAGGSWWMALGLLLVMGGAVVEMISVRPTPPPEDASW